MLKERLIWPLGSSSISAKLRELDNMPEPSPREPGGSCVYRQEHSPPNFRESRTYPLACLVNNIGLCLSCILSDKFESEVCCIKH
jgi:hypothetical protein